MELDCKPFKRERFLRLPFKDHSVFVFGQMFSPPAPHSYYFRLSLLTVKINSLLSPPPAHTIKIQNYSTIMNNQQNAEDPDEAAARRLQAEIWLADQEDEDDHGGNDNRIDLVRRLLRGENNAPPAGQLNNNNDDDDDEGENDEEEEDDEEGDEDDEDPAEDEEENDDHREAIDGGVAGEVFDEQRQKITRSLKCPLVRISFALHSITLYYLIPSVDALIL